MRTNACPDGLVVVAELGLPVVQVPDEESQEQGDCWIVIQAATHANQEGTVDVLGVRLGSSNE